MPSSIADSILGSAVPSGSQSTKTITAPPFSGPGSGNAPPDVASVIKGSDDKKSVCVDLPAFIQRMQLANWIGQAATAIGSNYNWAYVLSDPVPLGRYWEVVNASAVCLGGSGTSIQHPSLYLLKQGSRPAANSLPYQADITGFFAGQSSQDNNGAPVGPTALRVDELTDVVPTQGVFIGAEVSLIRSRKLIVPAGWSLMVYGGVNGQGQGGGLGEQWELKIVYSEFLSSEDTDVL
jgi:hypothetical protein